MDSDGQRRTNLIPHDQSVLSIGSRRNGLSIEALKDEGQDPGSILLGEVGNRTDECAVGLAKFGVKRLIRPPSLRYDGCKWFPARLARRANRPPGRVVVGSRDE
jgi:hypothetical protein